MPLKPFERIFNSTYTVLTVFVLQVGHEPNIHRTAFLFLNVTQICTNALSDFYEFSDERLSPKQTTTKEMFQAVVKI